MYFWTLGIIKGGFMKRDAVILAAGYSSRVGANKMALTINNQSILSYVIQTFYPFCERIVVVGGHHYAEIKELVKNYNKVILVKNEQYDLGMFSSVQRGVAEVENDFFLTPGDYPMILPSTCEQLLQGKGDIVVPIYKGRKGHPIFMKKALISSLLKEPITSNLKLFRDRQFLTYIEVLDEGVLLDVDTMNDYRLIKTKVEGRVNGHENQDLL